MMDRIKAAPAAIWKAVSSAIPALVPYLALVWGYVTDALDRMRRSFVALVSSPAVWLACIAIGVGGYVLGHGIGAAGKTGLRSEIASLQSARSAANERAEALAVQNRKALAQVAQLKGEVEALQAELRQAPKSAPVTAKRRRPATRTLKQAEAAPARFWWPWQ